MSSNPFASDEDYPGAWRRLRKRSPRRFDAEVLPTLRKTWETGDWYQRENLLTYLVSARPPDGIDIVWEGLRSDDETLRGTATVAALSYASNGYKPDFSQLEGLVEVVRSSTRTSTRNLALFVLEAAGFPIATLVGELAAADDTPPDFRFDLNIRLLLEGQDVKARLFSDLDRLTDHWDYDNAVERLWWHRDRLSLRSDEETMLWRHLLQRMAERREVCRSEQPYNTALILFSWIKKGLPAEPGDIDFLAEAAGNLWTSRDRLEAVRAVAWFANGDARRWLEKLREPPYQPAVRREAQRQLRKLTSGSPQR